MAHLAPKSLPFLALVLVGTAAAGAQQSAPAAAGSTALEGRWQVELFLDPRSLVNPPPAEKVSGEIAFGTDSWWGNSERFGRYAVDLRPFFGRFFAPPGGATPFSAADTSFLTEASGGIKGDSVVIDFIPRIDHLGLTFRGRFYGDSARGRWYRRGTDGYGPFVLRRVSKEPVRVAAIPDPAKQAAPASAQAVAKGGRRTTSRQQKAAAKTPPKPTQAVAQGTVRDTASNPAPSSARTVPDATEGTIPQAGAQNNRPAATRAASPPPKVETTVASAPPGAQQLQQQRTTAEARGGVSRTTPTPPARVEQRSNTAVAPPTQPAAQPATQPAPAAAQPARSVEGVLVAVTSSPLATPAPPRTDPAATGAIRVRIFDRASQKWFVTKYALKLPDGNWMLANLRTGGGAEGWGPAVRRTPGRHEVEIGDFVCGDKIWFLKNKISRAVEVKPGETADVSVDLDVTKEAAKPSLDNKSGARCGAAPGNAR